MQRPRRAPNARSIRHPLARFAVPRRWPPAAGIRRRTTAVLGGFRIGVEPGPWRAVLDRRQAGRSVASDFFRRRYPLAGSTTLSTGAVRRDRGNPGDAGADPVHVGIEEGRAA